MADIIKSPLNVLVGRLLRGAREMAKLKFEDVANEFVISATYLRAIESGARALPPHTAAGLVRLFNFDFFATSGLLVLVDRLDVRVGKKNAHKALNYESLEIQTRAAALAETAPYYREILDWLRDATARAETVAPLQESDLPVALLQELLERTPGAQRTVRPSGSSSPLLKYRLSPLIEDIVDQLATKLSWISPHIQQSNIGQWEENNSDRIANVYGYISNGESIISSLNKYSWSFMYNRLEPSMVVLVDGYKTKAIADLQAEVRHSLGRHLSERDTPRRKKITGRVHFLDGSTHRDDFQKLLRFDYMTREAATVTVNSDRHSPMGGRFQEFMNCWIYELSQDSIEGTSNRTHLAGFMDRYDSEEPQNTDYGVTLRAGHVRAWAQTFAQISDIPPELRKKLLTSR